MSTAIITKPTLAPVISTRRPASAIILTTGLFLPLIGPDLYRRDHQTGLTSPIPFRAPVAPTHTVPKSVEPAPTTVPSPASPSTQRVDRAQLPTPAPEQFLLVDAPAPSTPSSEQATAQIQAAPETSQDVPLPEMIAAVPHVHHQESAEAAAPVSAADSEAPVSMFVPLPETNKFLRIHAHIDYDTQLLAVRTTGQVDADQYHRVTYSHLEPQDATNLRAVCRSDTNAILGHAGGSSSIKFTPCQNAFLVDSMYRAGMFDRMDAVRVEALKGGALVLIVMEAKDTGLWFETPKGVARLRMGFWNGHAANRAVGVSPTLNLPSGGDVPLFSVRNGIAKERSVRHTRSVNDMMKELTDAWGDTVNLSAETAKTLTDMSSVIITKNEMRAIVIASMNRSLEGRHNNIQANAEIFEKTLLVHNDNRTPETLLDLVDAVASHVDQDRPVRKRAHMTEEQARTEASLVGIGARLKNAVIQEVVSFMQKS